MSRCTIAVNSVCTIAVNTEKVKRVFRALPTRTDKRRNLGPRDDLCSPLPLPYKPRCSDTNRRIPACLDGVARRQRKKAHSKKPLPHSASTESHLRGFSSDFKCFTMLLK